MASRKARISPRLRERVARAAGRRGGYCLPPERITGYRLTVGHIVPEAAGGESVEANLWLACNGCNEFKGAQTRVPDPTTGRLVGLFNPRRQEWRTHFRWSDDGTEIVGLTPCGRATVAALRLNRPELLAARSL
jgi:hypothetical protein